MAFLQVFTKPFLQDVKAIKKDKALLDRLDKKIDQILENPERYPLKMHHLKGKRSAHIGSYVVLFEVAGESVVFHRFRHHDHVYQLTP